MYSQKKGIEMLLNDLSPNAENLILHLLELHKKEQKSVDISTLDFSDQVIYETQQKRFIIVNGESISLSDTYLQHVDV